jgi:hypothetical protein
MRFLLEILLQCLGLGSEMPLLKLILPQAPRSRSTLFPRYCTMLRLKCLIQGEDIVFSVTPGCDDEVSDLKELIQSERALGSLKDVCPHALELWKVSAIDEPLREMTLLFSAQGLQLYCHQASRHSR